MEPYTFERLNEDNLSDVSFLVKSRLNKDHPVSYFQKKSEHPGPEADAMAGLPMKQRAGRPVAFVGVLPLGSPLLQKLRFCNGDYDTF